MDFQKDFDELFNTILTDYKNQFPEADTSQGSLIYIKSACMASALWGLYKYQEYISKQIFPDTADSENLDHHAWVRGLTRNPEESDSDLLARLLDYIRRPPAGGNQYDYVKWAHENANVKAAYCYPLAQGPGTVDVVIVADKDTTGTSLTGTTTAVETGKLIDDTADFTTSGVRIGDTVKNSTSGTETTVTAVDNDTTVSIASDIFTATGQSYIMISGSEVPSSYTAVTGTATAVQAGKLVDSTAGFSTSGVKTGDTVKNNTSSAETTVTAVDDNTTLSIESDIFTATGQSYTLTCGSAHSSYAALTGATTAVETDKLINSAAGFRTSGVRIGDVVKNNTLGTETTVTVVNNEGELTIASDIFTAAGQSYTLTSLITQVKNYIDDVRPVAASIVRVLPPAILEQQITMSVQGSNIDAAQIANDINAYLNNFEPGQVLYIAQLEALAITRGAEDATVTVPAGNLIPLENEIIRSAPDLIDVTIVQ